MNVTWAAAIVGAGLSLAVTVCACSSGRPDSKSDAVKVADTKTTETKTIVTKTTETKSGAKSGDSTSTETRSTATRTTGTKTGDATSAVRRAETVARTIKWENETWIPLNLASEGIEIKEIRFEAEGGVNFNPLRAGKGPQAFMAVKNTVDHKMKLAVAIALFDDRGLLVGASEITYGGSLDPGETGELKLTFRDVKRRFFDANTAQVALETYK